MSRYLDELQLLVKELDEARVGTARESIAAWLAANVPSLSPDSEEYAKLMQSVTQMRRPVAVQPKWGPPGKAYIVDAAEMYRWRHGAP